MVQLQVLNYIVQTGDKVLMTEYCLDESYFSEFPEEFRFIKEHVDKYTNVPDVYTFGAAFPNWKFVEVKESRQYLFEKLCDDKYDKESINMLEDARECFMTGKGGRDVYSRVLDYVNRLESNAIIKTHSYTDTASRFNEYAEKVKDFNKFYIPTGFNELDDICGGWSKTELAVIAARPGIGKTWILIKSAVSAMTHGYRVGFYSGEMSADEIFARMDTIISSISNYGITRGQSEVQLTYKNFLDSISKKDYYFEVLTPADLGDYATVSDLRAFVTSKNLDILFIDQYSLLNAEGTFKAEHEKVASISKGLRAMGIIKKIPIIIASQQNREKTDKNGPSTANVALSDRIAQDCTMNIFIEQNENNILKLLLKKIRSATPNGELSYNVSFDSGKFSYISETATAESEQMRKEFETFNTDGNTDEFNF